MEMRVEIWLAVAVLHEAGLFEVSPSQIHAEVRRLFDDRRSGILTHIVAFANAAAPPASATPHCYLVRVRRGAYRLCRETDPVHPFRVGRPLSPDESELLPLFWPLWRKWSAWQKGLVAAAEELTGVGLAAAALDGSESTATSLDVEVEPGRPWFWEGNVQAKVIAYLQGQGYAGAKKAGKDIFARNATGRSLCVSVRGYPQKSPATLARQWFASAVLDMLLTRGEHADLELALGLPVVHPTYRGFAEHMAWLRHVVPFRIYWVAESGEVWEDTP